MRILKTLLALNCWFTLLATVYLTVSVLVLRPPRLNVPLWIAMAAFFSVQGAMTLLAIKEARGGRAIRRVVVAGALALIGVSGSWVYATLSGGHFEGYALLLGSALVVQGALTLSVFVRPALISIASGLSPDRRSPRSTA
jgi:hypothetical protein